MSLERGLSQLCSPPPEGRFGGKPILRFNRDWYSRRTGLTGKDRSELGVQALLTPKENPKRKPKAQLLLQRGDRRLRGGGNNSLLGARARDQFIGSEAHLRAFRPFRAPSPPLGASEARGENQYYPNFFLLLLFFLCLAQPKQRKRNKR